MKIPLIREFLIDVSDSRKLTVIGLRYGELSMAGKTETRGPVYFTFYSCNGQTIMELL